MNFCQKPSIISSKLIYIFLPEILPTLIVKNYDFDNQVIWTEISFEAWKNRVISIEIQLEAWKVEWFWFFKADLTSRLSTQGNTFVLFCTFVIWMYCLYELPCEIWTLKLKKWVIYAQFSILSCPAPYLWLSYLYSCVLRSS